MRATSTVSQLDRDMHKTTSEIRTPPYKENRGGPNVSTPLMFHCHTYYTQGAAHQAHSLGQQRKSRVENYDTPFITTEYRYCDSL